MLKISTRKSVVFFISDFIDKKYWDSLKVVNRKHDLIGIHLFDEAEYKLPNAGVIKVEDAESNDAFWIDTSNHFLNLQLQEKLSSDKDELIKNAKNIGFDLISISTKQDYIDPLLAFFKMREKRS